MGSLDVGGDILVLLPRGRLVLREASVRDRRDRELHRERERERDRAARDKDRERDRAIREEEEKRRSETERRGEQLREAWRQHHPEEDSEKGRPEYDEVLVALERALMDNPRLREAPVEELARQLVLGGYLEKEPSIGLMGEVMTTIASQKEAFGSERSWPLEEL